MHLVIPHLESELSNKTNLVRSTRTSNSNNHLLYLEEQATTRRFSKILLKRIRSLQSEHLV
jgi:hypothetical protein